MTMKKTILITGGCRSGKSKYALELSSRYNKKVFIATAEAIDNEMGQRIIKHRKKRDKSFITIEEPLYVAKSLKALTEETDVVVIDCLTLWLGNLIHQRELQSLEFPEVTSFLEVIKCPALDIIIVTNEVGLGVIPGNPLGRHFCDLAGELNQKVASLAQKVFFMVSGIPMELK